MIKKFFLQFFFFAKDKKHTLDLFRMSFRDLIDPDPVGVANKIDYNQFQRFEHFLRLSKQSFWNFDCILDFGCGDGRFLHLFNKHVRPKELFGCDVLPARVTFCKKKIPHANIFLSKQYPPINLPNKKFDLIFSYSVFTHLSEPNHLNWLKELSRILKPGGYMLHTFKSEKFAWRQKIFSPQFFKKYKLSKSEIKKISNPTKENIKFTIDNSNLPEYGLTILNKKYILKNWPKVTGMKIERIEDDIIESFPEGCQGLVLLKK